MGRFSHGAKILFLSAIAGAALAQPVGYHHLAQLPRSHTLDLETGERGGRQADLVWNTSRGEAYLAAMGGAAFALMDGAAWERIDAEHLGRLAYAEVRFPAAKGTLLAVRTAEGNLAKLRILEVQRNGRAQVEWVLYLK